MGDKGSLSGTRDEEESVTWRAGEDTIRQREQKDTGLQHADSKYGVVAHTASQVSSLWRGSLCPPPACLTSSPFWVCSTNTPGRERGTSLLLGCLWGWWPSVFFTVFCKCENLGEAEAWEKLKEAYVWAPSLPSTSSKLSETLYLVSSFKDPKRWL